MVQQLTKGKQPNQHRNETDPLFQHVHIERDKPFDACPHMHAHGADEHTEGAGDQVAQGRAAADGGQHGQAEDRQSEIFDMAETGRDRGQRGGGSNEDNETNNAAHHAGKSSHAKRPTGFAPL